MLSKYYTPRSQCDNERVNMFLIDLQTLKHDVQTCRDLVTPLVTNTISSGYANILRAISLHLKTQTYRILPRQKSLLPVHFKKAGETMSISSVSSYTKSVQVDLCQPRYHFFLSGNKAVREGQASMFSTMDRASGRPFTKLPKRRKFLLLLFFSRVVFSLFKFFFFQEERKF